MRRDGLLRLEVEPGIETVARSGSRPRPGILSSVITEEVQPMPGIDERAGITAARRPEFDVMRAFVVAGLVVSRQQRVSTALPLSMRAGIEASGRGPHR